MIAPTPNKVVVVTTNYDRLPDYAADGIGASSVTGFEGSYIRKLELPNNSVTTKRVRARERIVEIWKVHGSLDWFIDAKGDISSFRLLQEIPTGFSPLIVPPGKDKYSSTHIEASFQKRIRHLQPREHICVLAMVLTMNTYNPNYWRK